MISNRVCSRTDQCSQFRDWIFRQIEPLWTLMKILTIIARVLLGLGFVVFGSNAFLHFIPMPPIPQTLAGDFTRVFIASGWASVIGALQVIGGLLLLIGRFVPLGDRKSTRLNSSH